MIHGGLSAHRLRRALSRRRGVRGLATDTVVWHTIHADDGSDQYHRPPATAAEFNVLDVGETKPSAVCWGDGLKLSWHSGSGLANQDCRRRRSVSKDSIFMTFSCGNHDFDTDVCKKLQRRCIMGRPGCVLRGKVKVCEETVARLLEQEKTAPPPRRIRPKRGQGGD